MATFGSSFDSRVYDCLAGGGVMGALMRAHSWQETPLGPVDNWPQSLRTCVSICLNSRFAILVWWGPELVMLYNDAYREIIGAKHPAALGMPGRQCFPEIWEIIGPMLDNVVLRGEATRSDDALIYLERNGYPEECYFTFAFSPIRNESGGIGGVFTPVAEVSEKVIGARRLNTLQQLASCSQGARDARAICGTAAGILSGNLTDVPFSGTYLYTSDGSRAELVARSGNPTGGIELPEELPTAGHPSWAAGQSIVLPLVSGKLRAGFLVAGISPHKHLDEPYRTFFELAAGQIAAAISEASAYAEERKRVEALAKKDRELREQAELERQRWHNLLKSAPAAIALLRGPELVFELVNDEYIRASGRSSPAEFERRRFRDALPELVDQGYVEQLLQVYRSGQPSFGKRRRMKLSRFGDDSLEERFFNCTYQPARGSTGEIQGVFVHAVDVTEEVLAERRLEESEAQFRNLADSIPNLAWIADTTGARPWFNRRWYEYTGLQASETTGWGWLKVHHPDLVEGVVSKYKKQIENGELWEDTVRLRGRTGGYRWLLSRAIPIRSSEGHPVRWFVTSTDVTFEIEAQQRLGEAQRLESVGRLAGGIAHDFNNLLVPIIGYACVARETLAADNPVHPFFSEIEQACQRAADLTRQLLAYAGKTRFVVTQVDVETVARETVALASTSIPKGVEIIIESPSTIPAVEADPAEVEQILMNLILNAAEAIGEHPGTINIRIGVTQMANPSSAGLAVAGNVRPGSYVFVEVRDTGCGMDDATQRQIFEPFFSTKFLGRGLGLAAVAGIIRTHEWGLTLQSASGEGSTFRVFLRAVSTEAQPFEPAAPAVIASAGSRSILVVDDEDVVRRIAKLALERHGYRVVLAESGAAAVQSFRSAAGTFDLILLDLSMPGMNGHETLAALRAIDPQVKALVSSGYSEQQALEMFSGHPTVGFIQKPYTPAKLAATVKNVLKQPV